MIEITTDLDPQTDGMRNSDERQEDRCSRSVLRVEPRARVTPSWVRNEPFLRVYLLSAPHFPAPSARTSHEAVKTQSHLISINPRTRNDTNITLKVH